MTVTADQLQVRWIREHLRIVNGLRRDVVDVVDDNASSYDATIPAALAKTMCLLDVFSPADAPVP